MLVWATTSDMTGSPFKAKSVHSVAPRNSTSPMRAALVFKQMNIGALRHLLEFLNELLNLLAVKLVIAENVDNRSIGKAPQGPLQAVSAGADVTGQDHGIRRNRRRCEGLKLQVQVAENVKAHGTG